MKTNESEHLRINEARWDKWAETIDGRSRKYDYLRSVQMGVISLLDLKENVSLLDIGCGTGWALGQAAKRVDGKGTFVGIDLSDKMIEKAVEKFKGFENFRFIKANAEEIPFEDGQFDFIICNNSFHHYLHQDKALKEMYRLLKPGGKIHIVDPSVDMWLVRILTNAHHLFSKDEVKFNTSREFQKLITDAGFRYLEARRIVYHQRVQVGEKVSRS